MKLQKSEIGMLVYKVNNFTPVVKSRQLNLNTGNFQATGMSDRFSIKWNFQIGQDGP